MDAIQKSDSINGQLSKISKWLIVGLLSHWIAITDWQLSVAELPFGNMGQMSPRGRNLPFINNNF
jgi:hypothetical protein